MQNLMVVFILSVLAWDYYFGENLVQKVKIVSLSCNHHGAEISVILLVGVQLNC